MNPVELTEMVDRIVGDRYRLEALIGVGQVSAVFAAQDQLEQRRVALKIFDDALANDESFIEQLFEAVERSALLAHPNIVEIFDWGVDDGAYVVSELCEGGSLASLIEAGHSLQPSQALVMALQCARALNYGHEQGAIHRNLTPRNVLFTDDEQVRVADYGLAKVMAEAPVSQASRALENVRYASPEQARGRPVGESSDLYTLALVVNEAVSGYAPKVAETVVGTLMERAEAPALLDASLEGLLPALERCGRVDADQRPEAEELVIALLASAETMPRPNAMPLVGLGFEDADSDWDLEPDADIAAPDDDALQNGGDTPMLGATIAAVPGLLDGPAATTDDDDADFDVSALGELDELDAFGAESVDEAQVELQLVVDEPAAGGLDNLEQADPVFAEVPGSDVELDIPEPVLAGHGARPAYEEDEDDTDVRLPWWPLVLLGVLAAGAIAAGVYFFALSSSIESAKVPDLLGLQFDEAGDRVADRDWTIDRLEARIDGSAVGSIIAQSPSPGEELDEGEKLVLTVSLGNAMVEIPSDIVGLSVEQAASRLGSVGLQLGRLSEETTETLVAGLVIGLDEPTTQTPSGATVDLRVSSGPEDRAVPAGLAGMTIGDATSVLVGLRLQAVEDPAYSPDIEVGTVLASIPNAGEIVPADSTVTLIVSAGPEPVEMPDIVGLSLDEAIEVITELGLIFIDSEGDPGEDVIGSLPPIGATADVGTEVTIILAESSEDEEDDG